MTRDRKKLLETIDMLERCIIRKTGAKMTRILQIDKDTGETIETFLTVEKAAEKTGIKRAAIASCVSGVHRLTSGGFIWRKEIV